LLKIATILLGLSIGVHPIELIVEEPVVSVRVLLDDREITVLDSPPWKFDCDLGRELRPYELSVIGFDREGKVVARDRVEINLPRRLTDELDDARLHLLRESGSEHPTAVRIDWNSLRNTEIREFEVSLNGVAIRTDSLSRIALPEYDADEIQLLEVRLGFGNENELRLERAFGGGILPDQVATALTGIPISLVDKKSEPNLTELDGHFTVGSRRLAVRTVEIGKAEIYIVLAPGTTPLPMGSGRLLPGPRGKRPANNPLLHKLVIPFPIDRGQGREGRSVLFPILDLQIPDNQVGLRIAGGRTGYGTQAPVAQLADAVAVAGRLASGSGNRRALVVFVGPDHEDESAHSINAVRGYLKELHVPLYVWSTKSGDTAWGPSRRVDTVTALNAGLRSMWKELSTQRIVWLNGVVPIHRVEIVGSDLFHSVSAERGPSKTKTRTKQKN
jgi:hypothetical protein